MSFFSHSKSFQRLLLLSLFGASTMLVTASTSFAQDDDDGLPYAERYRFVEVDEDGPNKRAQSQTNRDAKAARRDDMKALQAILTSGGNPNVQATQDFFDGFVFPSMTKSSNLTKAGRLRYEFDRAYLGTKYVSASRVPFIENIALPGLKKLIDNEDLSPAARVNAVVLISRLDEAPLVRTSKTPPRPSLRAFDELISVWRGNYPEFIKAAAFSGILRHMDVDDAVNTARIPGDRKNQLMAAVTASVDKILGEDPELKGDLNRWKVTKSIELMSKSRLQNESPKYFDRMTAMLAEDSKVPRWVKLEAIRGLARLPMTGVSAEKINGLVESATMYASKSIAEEGKGLDQRVRKLVYDNILWGDVDLEATGTDYTDNPSAPSGGMGMGMGGGGKGGSMGGMMGGGMKGGSMGGMMGGGMGSGTKGGGMGMGGMMGGGMGMMDEEPIKPLVELPNYEMNMARRRLKLVAYSVNSLLTLKAVKEQSTERHQAELGMLEKRFGKFLKEGSSIGIVDLDKKMKMMDDEEPQRESYAMQLKSACEIMSTELNNSVANMRGVEPQAAPGAAPGAAPFGKGAEPGAAPGGGVADPFGNGN